MKAKDGRNKILWVLSMIGLLAISYWICRFAFFEMHGMIQWPTILAILSIVTIVSATIFGNRIVSIAPVIGYMGGFIIAMAFSSDTIDPGGGQSNNAWIIWGIVLISSVLIGILWSFNSLRRRKIVIE